MPTPARVSDLKETVIDFRRQYIAATVRQEELLKAMLDLQKGFRDDCNAAAIRHEAILKKLVDKQTSLLIKEETQTPNMIVRNEVDQICKLGKVTVGMDLEPNTLQLNLPVCSGPLVEVQPGEIDSNCIQEDSDLNDIAQKTRLSASSSEKIPPRTPSAVEMRTTVVSRITQGGFRSLRTTHLTGVELAQEDAGKVTRIIDHPYFKGVIYGVILINALAMGLQVDLKGGLWDQVWQVLDYMSTAVFIIEAIIKMYCLRLQYFLNVWDLLDFLIVCSAIADLFMSGGNLAVFQILRLVRLVKILKMKRDLIALIEGIFASLRAMLWVCVLMALAIYSGAILCVDVIRNEDGYQSYGFDNSRYFGDLGSSMLTLFSIAILDTWSTVVWPVSRVQPYMIPFFGFFLLITSFALMNALIGIVVERTTVAATLEKEHDEQVMRENKLHIALQLVQLVGVMDNSHDGLITVDELEKVKDSEAFKQMMDQFDFPPGFSLSDLHLMLDDNGNGEMSSEEFIDGIFKLLFCFTEFHNQCTAKLSIAQIKQDIFKLRKDIFKEMKSIRDELAK